MADLFDRMEAEKKQGRKWAEQNRTRLENEVRTRDRFQQSAYLRNMIKALEIHPWRNSPRDWQRYYEAKIVLAARRKPGKKAKRVKPAPPHLLVSRKNPCGAKTTRKNPYAKGTWIVRKIKADGRSRTKGQEYKSYLAARRAANKMMRAGGLVGYRGIELLSKSQG